MVSCIIDFVIFLCCGMLGFLFGGVVVVVIVLCRGWVVSGMVVVLNWGGDWNDRMV